MATRCEPTPMAMPKLLRRRGEIAIDLARQIETAGHRRNQDRRL